MKRGKGLKELCRKHLTNEIWINLVNRKSINQGGKDQDLANLQIRDIKMIEGESLLKEEEKEGKSPKIQGNRKQDPERKNKNQV
jgi:hypothetical protein